MLGSSNVFNIVRGECYSKLRILIVFSSQCDDPFEEATVGMGVAGSESNEIQRFELLRTELIELEKRVQKSTDRSENEEVTLTILARLYSTYVTYLCISTVTSFP